MRGGILFSVLFVNLGVVSCGGDPTVTEDPAGPPATIQIFSGDQQRAEVLTTLPNELVVEVLDAEGRFVSGQTVTFATTSGGNLSPATAVTNPSGQGRTTYTLGPSAGQQTVSAATAELTPVTFTVFADPGSATNLIHVSGDEQSGVVASLLADAIVVRVTDASQNPVAGANVTFAAVAGSADPTSVETDDAGEAATAWTLGTAAGVQELLANLGSEASLTLSATALAGPPQDLAIVSGDGQTGTRNTELFLPIQVQVTDAYDNPNADVTVTFATSDGSITPETAMTDANGFAETTWTLGATLGTNTATVTAAGLAPVNATAEATVPLIVLDHVAVDATLDPAGDRIVTVSADPSRLNVVDPLTGNTTSVNLSLTPTAVSVQPDGAYAAVGHNGFVSYVDLGSMTVQTVYDVTADVIDVVLPGNGWLYAFPRIDQWETIRSVELATGTETTTGTIYAGTLARLHPSGDYIYGADNGLSPSDFEKYDIQSGVASYLYDSPYHGDYSFAGNLWIYDDGTRIIARSGNVFRSSSVQAEDMLYVGSLPDAGLVTSAAHSSTLGRVLLVGQESFGNPGAPELRSYTDTFLSYQGSLYLPPYVEVDGTTVTTFTSEGRWVLINAAGTRAYVLVRGRDFVGRFNTGLVVFEAADIM